MILFSATISHTMRRIIFIVILIGSLVVIYNLTISIYSLWRKQDLLFKAQNDLEQAKKESDSLKKKLEVVKSSTYIEEQARTKLFMGKASEQEIIIAAPTPGVSKSLKKQHIPFWKEWWDLFF